MDDCSMEMLSALFADALASPLLAKVQAPQTPGSMVFVGADGAYAEDNSHLFWDALNKILDIVGTANIHGAAGLTGLTVDVNGNVGIGTSTSIFGGASDRLLSIVATGDHFPLIAFGRQSGSGYTSRTWGFGVATGGQYFIQDVTANTNRVLIDIAGNFNIFGGDVNTTGGDLNVIDGKITAAHSGVFGGTTPVTVGFGDVNNRVLSVIASGDSYPVISATRQNGGAYTNRTWAFGIGNGGQFFFQDVTAGGLNRLLIDTSGDYSEVGIITSRIGASSGTMTNIGRLDAQTSASGIGNAADTTDDTLFTYTLALNSMSANGKSLRAIATGHFASNGNNKRVKFWFAGTAIADSGVLTSNNVDWACQIDVTQIDSTHVSCVGTFTVNGVASVITVTANLAVSNLSSNNSVVKVTGASPTTGAANDVLGYLMRTEFMN